MLSKSIARKGKSSSDAIEDLFKQLDADGNGTISWWEWKNFLQIYLFAEEINNSTLNLWDPLVLQLIAVEDALDHFRHLLPVVTVTTGGSSNSSSNNSSTARTSLLSSSPLTPTEENLMSYYDTDISNLSPDKAIAKLELAVKCLQVNNSHLTQRLERALANDATLNPSTNDAMGSPMKRVDAGRSLHRARETNELIEKIKSSTDLEFSSKTADCISMAEYRKLQLSPREPNSLKPPAAQQLLENEILFHQRKIVELKELKSKKLKAIVVMSRVLGRWIQRYRNKKRQSATQYLSQVLGRYSSRKHLQGHIEKRNRAAIKIQSRFRGDLERQSLRLQSHAALLIQCQYRVFCARKLRQKYLLEKAASIFSAKFRATNLIQRLAHKWLLRSREKKKAAAQTIQSIFRGKVARNMFLAKKSQLEEAQRVANLQSKSSILIQKCIRRRIAKTHYQLAKAKINQFSREKKASAKILGVLQQMYETFCRFYWFHCKLFYFLLSVCLFDIYLDL